MKPARHQQFFALAALIFVFAGLMALVWNGETTVFDTSLRTGALSMNTPTTVIIWEDISLLGSVIVLSGFTVFTICVFAIWNDWFAVRFIAIAMSGAVGLDVFFKWFVHRPRPAEVYAHTMPASFSFPSGHALYSFVLYFALASMVDRQYSGKWKWLIWCCVSVLVSLIGASRIFLGVHYGSDVLGGYVIGATWLLQTYMLTETKKL